MKPLSERQLSRLKLVGSKIVPPGMGHTFIFGAGYIDTSSD